MAVKEEEINKIVTNYKENHFLFEQFMLGVENAFRKHPKLNLPPLPALHSIRTRLKDVGHLQEKIERKYSESNISVENYSQLITDLAGVRVLHLYQDQFPTIHDVVHEYIKNKDWVFHEPPKAYTWDPESKDFFDKLGLDLEIKESLYTSVHYVVRPRIDALVCCEIQVRTLLEETWGEIDHALNYPTPTKIVACREQLRVLARVVGAGSRLADSIFRTASEK